MNNERPCWSNRLPVDRLDCIFVMVAIAGFGLDIGIAFLNGVIAALEIYIGMTDLNWDNGQKMARAAVAPLVIWLTIRVFRHVLQLYRVAP